MPRVTTGGEERGVLRIQLDELAALRVLVLALLFAGGVDHLPLDTRRRGRAVGGRELDVGVVQSRVLDLHHRQEGGLVHLRRPKQRLEPAVEERQGAVAHLELCVRLELVVTDRAVLSGVTRTPQAVHPLNDHVAKLGDQVGLCEQLLKLRALHPAHVVVLLRPRLGQLERVGEHLVQREGAQPLSRIPPLLVTLALVARLLRILAHDAAHTGRPSAAIARRRRSPSQKRPAALGAARHRLRSIITGSVLAVELLAHVPAMWHQWK